MPDRYTGTGIPSIFYDPDLHYDLPEGVCQERSRDGKRQCQREAGHEGTHQHQNENNDIWWWGFLNG